MNENEIEKLSDYFEAVSLPKPDSALYSIIRAGNCIFLCAFVF